MSGRRVRKQTTAEDWARSDAYHNSFLIPQDDALDGSLQHSKDQGLPNIAVSVAQGKLLHLLAKSIGAKRILEVGTLGGYSAIWLARALPEGGSLVTLELDPHHAEVAKANLTRAGVADKTTILIGPASESLKTLERNPPFDLAFIDADKEGNLDYFRESKRLVRSGGVIIVDNVIRNARVADPNEEDDALTGVRRLLAALKEDSEVDATTIGTAGEKGYDGFIYALRK